MHIGAKDVHVQLQLLANRLDILKALLVVRTCTSYPDLDLMFNKSARDLSQGTNDAFESRSDLNRTVSVKIDQKSETIIHL